MGPNAEPRAFSCLCCALSCCSACSSPGKPFPDLIDDLRSFRQLAVDYRDKRPVVLGVSASTHETPWKLGGSAGCWALIAKHVQC